MRQFLLLGIVLLMSLRSQGSDLTTLLFGSSDPKIKYIGQMADNGKDKTGTGMERLKKGGIYIGDFLHGKYNGLGMQIITENSEIKHCPGAMVYVGKWVNGKKEGKGTCYGANGDIIYEGTFSEDKPMSAFSSYRADDDSKWFSTLSLSNGEFYLGEIKNGFPDGFGLFMLTDGLLNIGRVKAGKRSGVSLLIAAPDSWELVNWENSKSYSPITSSNEYASRKKVYNEVKAREIAQFKSEMSEVVSGLMSTASEFQSLRASSAGSSSDNSYNDSPASYSGSSKSSGSKGKSSKGKNDCGSAWMSDSRVYHDYESQLSPNGSRTAIDPAQRKSIQSKMKAIRKKWETRGCPISKSSYED